MRDVEIKFDKITYGVVAECLNDWKAKYVKDQTGPVQPGYATFNQPENNMTEDHFHYKTVLLKTSRLKHRKQPSPETDPFDNFKTLSK